MGRPDEAAAALRDANARRGSAAGVRAEAERMAGAAMLRN
jgi:hypothetical protein